MTRSSQPLLERLADELCAALEPLLEAIDEDDYVAAVISAHANTVEVRLTEFKRELNAVQAAR